MDWLVGLATLALLGVALVLIGAVVVRAGLRLRRVISAPPPTYHQPDYDPLPPVGTRPRDSSGLGFQMVVILGWAWFCLTVIGGTGWLASELLAGADLSWPYRAAALFGPMTAATVVLLLVAVPRLPDETRVELLRDELPSTLLLLPAAAVLGYLFRNDAAELIAGFTAVLMFSITSRIIVYVLER